MSFSRAAWLRPTKISVLLTLLGARTFEGTSRGRLGAASGAGFLSGSFRRNFHQRPGGALGTVQLSSALGAGWASRSFSSWTEPSASAPVIVVPVLSDNFSYLLVDPETKVAAAVDPAEPSKVLTAAKEAGVKITHALVTHKHWDHAGGNEEISKSVPGIEIVSTAYENIPCVTKALKDGESIEFGSLRVTALYTPCHTKGHVLFFVESLREPSKDPLLFSGDTLFVGGCGRFFEGEAADMVRALRGVIGQLPPNTQVFCGHEYTKSNLKFALAVEPGNQVLQEKFAWTERTLKEGGVTVPSTVGEEKLFNPFMRLDSPEIREALVKSGRARGRSAAVLSEADVMAGLRSWKNSF
uniref:hydroxyacylglutathione hydrolase n=1 Tax=Chromera velia CCMP2878 TaxID=1169474 RepID=A0A0G4HI18_9ALVE|mmetsp:Transcript_1519/g.3165  ORF Transcript_1519/g.3165 Transcript_1519/m.3165 type:complete len:355 (-) Transcript_1519:153-1217(-)|eukprot:Cvel_27690.t1-p1 / transcript=Cvel_27690.t1 / gene=Cvel_27690 / organism=Chromera_velia_CCMP2878 / gene_product=Hydroxyacylglutathione hydrolase, mitochondrial, putative / transcript_product=Hydroxyacylglutathione hydrolase, mitochondrial, putative / location=Cvel_scaffold3495:8898-13589(+) / protein_length=354 / sequence_SO=supercontig / SO=protein_coding / is_pseudo=false